MHGSYGYVSSHTHRIHGIFTYPFILKRKPFMSVNIPFVPWIRHGKFLIPWHSTIKKPQPSLQFSDRGNLQNFFRWYASRGHGRGKHGGGSGLERKQMQGLYLLSAGSKWTFGRWQNYLVGIINTVLICIYIYRYICIINDLFIGYYVS